jgi:hypothetical protein
MPRETGLPSKINSGFLTITIQTIPAMNLPAQIAKHFREAHFGGNWTDVSLKDALQGVTWEMAVTKVHSFNTIAVLVFHTNYYVSRVLQVLQGAPLDASDKLSFGMPPVSSQQDWEALLERTWREAETFAGIIEGLPESRLAEDFTDPKYGSYYRNLHGITEHLHYHLGQIVLIKKILQEEAA